MESSWPAGSHLEAVDLPPLPGAPHPFVVSSALPPSGAILVKMLEFSCALQASVISLPLLAVSGPFLLLLKL